VSLPSERKPMLDPVPKPRPKEKSGWAWLGHAASGFGLLVLALLPGHKYAWMQAVDPATDPAALEDASGNRLVLATLVMLLAVGLQALGLFKGASVNSARHRVAAWLLMAAVVAVWAVKFRA